MITGEIKAQVDRIWDAFWTGGISNPMEVIEQLTYLLFIKRLDEIQTLKERKSRRFKTAIEEPIFPEGKTENGRDYQVWFYDMQADGFSLDDKRNPSNQEKHEQNNIPDIIARFHNQQAEDERTRTEQSFLVPKADIQANDYDLSINRYKEIVYEEVAYDPPQTILAELEALEDDIQQGMRELKAMLKG